MADLRDGEIIVHCKGGAICPVCMRPVPEGPAVKLSFFAGRVRHLHCMPRTSTREQDGGRKNKRRNK